MKNLFFFAAAAAMMMASCAKEAGVPKGETKIVVTVNGVQGSGETRATEAAAIANQITLTSGHVFVIGADDTVLHGETLTALTTGSSQTIGATADNGKQMYFPSSSKVFILANIPSDVAANTLDTWAKIEAAKSVITASRNTNYKTPAMANSNGTPAALANIEENVAAPTATASVTLSPLYSRIELTGITGGANIADFKVSGVFVDEYNTSFSMTGAGDGLQSAGGDKTKFVAGWLGDIYTTPEEATDAVVNGDENGLTSNATYSPASSQVWAYHTGAGTKPVFIIHLTGVKVFPNLNPGPGIDYETDNIADLDLTGDGAAAVGEAWITVTGYAGLSTPNFVRGKVYKVSNINFNKEQLGAKPNPVGVAITATVTINDWTMESLTPQVSR